jgi:Skp family chaperone for outer membrane proteins
MKLKKIAEGTGVGSLQKKYAKVLNDIQSELEMYKKTKDTPQAKKHVDNLKKLNDLKKQLVSAIDQKVSGMYRDAEWDGKE